MKNPYEDLIHLPHHVSETHPRMPVSDRAAQFSPFAALTGYGDAVRETGRYTEEKEELDENMLELLDRTWEDLERKRTGQTAVTVTYFVPDGRKKGGSYETITGTVKKVDRTGRMLTMEDGQRICLDDILEISGF